mmetsp:Transcript_42397/g.112207  ORF Transcript_42397/g.112207 Transcript_42397/m.112207 type:complete len:90 (-) Transcript_42397:159-428(-)
MQSPGENLAVYQRSTSTSAMWARIRARGMFPMPMVGRTYLVKAEEDPTKIWGNTTLSPWNTKWFASDNVLFLTMAIPAGVVYFMHKLPK